MDDPAMSMQLRLSDSDWSAMCDVLLSSFKKWIGCAHCGKGGVVLHNCSVCRGTVYCGKEYSPNPPLSSSLQWLVHLWGCLLTPGVYLRGKVNVWCCLHQG